MPLPAGLSLRESMMLGTAGFTAGLCIDALHKHGFCPTAAKSIVTGASGGVGGMAVNILGGLWLPGRGRKRQTVGPEYLRGLGATRVLTREQVDDPSGRPLLSARWAGGVDTVGGNILFTILRTALGTAASWPPAVSPPAARLPITVFPFILRAVTLWVLMWRGAPSRCGTKSGSGWLRHGNRRNSIRWPASSTWPSWPKYVNDILAGRIIGRVVVNITPENA